MVLVDTAELVIGTRESKLAIWQAEQVSGKLAENGYPAELRFIKTEGDRLLDTPLPLLGGKGVFTKALDQALFDGQIDMAVHSLKDIPTILPEGLKIAAVLQRGDPEDTLVTRNGTDFLRDDTYKAVIATSSTRRKAQWLLHYPNHTIVDIRGNVQTRLRKVSEGEMDGAIFAAAGLIRLGLEDKIDSRLDWMVPAPAQGAVAVMIREDDLRLENILSPINDEETALCTAVERDFQNRLETGCSAPVGAHAVVNGDQIRIKTIVLSPDATEHYDLEMIEPVSKAHDLGIRAAEKILKQGADHIVRMLKNGKLL